MATEGHLFEVSDLEQHLAYFERLLEKYPWSRELEAKVRKEIVAVRSRIHDSRLYLGVIGEFSSGKSTLINALIEDRILATDILQATTSTPTMIEFGEVLEVEGHAQDGSIVRLAHPRDSSGEGQTALGSERYRGLLREFIDRHTAEEEVAKGMQWVRLKHPSNVLHNGLVIVDTPGTNADNPRHTSVAKMAVTEICDAMMIVIQVDSPVSQSLVRFVKETLGHRIHRSVFVVTKVDLLGETERKRMTAFFERKLKSEFGLKDLHLFWSSPLSVLNAMAQGGPTTDPGVTLFREARKNIRDILLKNRLAIQAENLCHLTKEIIRLLQSELTLRERRFKVENEGLRQNLIEDVEPWCDGGRRAVIASFEGKVLEKKRLLSQNVWGLFDELETGLIMAIDAAPSLEVLKQKLADITDKSIAFNRAIMGGIDKGRSELVGDAQVELTQFLHEFSKDYERLATLGGQIKLQRHIEIDLGNLGKSALGNPNFEMVVASAEVALRQENDAIGTGGIGGAILGTILFGPFGLLFGLFGGRALGSLFGPSLAKVKGDCRAKVRGAISEAQRQSTLNVENALTEIGDFLCDQLRATVEQAYREYRVLADRMRARDEAKRKEIQQARERISAELHELKNRYGILDAIQVALGG